MAVQQMIVAQRQNIVPSTVDRVDTSWGWLPVITLLQTSALLLVAIAYSGNRNGAAWATPLFWLSLVVIFAPSALRVSFRSISRKERMGLVIATGLALYLVKMLYTPIDFTFHDEFLHWRT